MEKLFEKIEVKLDDIENVIEDDLTAEEKVAEIKKK